DSANGARILTSELVQGLTANGGVFAFQEVGSLTLKGISDPVRAYEVTWKTATGSIPLPPVLGARPAEAFVGRDEELQKLSGFWKQAADGARTLVMLGGDPGIGKTRLATELARGAHAQGAIVLYGGCEEDVLVPYRPYIQ